MAITVPPHCAHTFGFISPEMTAKYGIPNPCVSCHQGKTSQWASGWAKRWYSPWRAE